MSVGDPSGNTVGISITFNDGISDDDLILSAPSGPVFDTTTPLTRDAPHVFQLRHTGSAWQLWIDGTLFTTASLDPGDPTLPSLNFILGATDNLVLNSISLAAP